MTRTLLAFFFAVTLSLPSTLANVPVELKGSPASMQRQHEVARHGGFSFVETLDEIDRKIASGELVMINGNDNYQVNDGLSSDAARPEMRVFIERLAAEYFEATGEKLVVTSLTRPSTMQPHNSHPLSIHPTGLAVDFRISQKAESRKWIEQRLLEMEAAGLLDITREQSPPHYHIALFPDPYLAHVEATIGAEALAWALENEAGTVNGILLPVPGNSAPVRTSLWAFFSAIFFR